MDEIIRLRNQIEGEEQVRNLRATYASAREEVEKLYKAMGSGADFADAARPHLEQMVDLFKKIGDQEQDLRKLGGGFGNLNDQIFQTGRVLQDFIAGSTYGGLRGGLIAISNNIEQLAATFTKSTAVVQGLAVAMTALPIVMPLLERSFGSLLELFRDKAPEIFASRLDELRARLKEFEDKKVKVSFDYTEIELTKKRIKELEDARAALDRTLGAQSKAEAESGRRVGAAIAETPGAQDILTQIVTQAGVGARRGEGPQGVAVAARQQEIARIRDRMAELDKAIGRGGEGTESLLAEWAKLNERLGDQLTRLTTDQDKAARAAEEEIGKVLLHAKTGREAEQQQAQGRLALMFAKTGSEAGKAAARAILDANTVRVANEEAIKEAKSETDRIAHDLARGPLGVEFLRGAEISPERVRGELEKTLPPETAAKWANVIARSFTEVLAGQVADEAQRTGVMPDVARRQIAARMEAATPVGQAGAAAARLAMQEEARQQQAAAGRFPDLDLTLRQELLKRREAGQVPGVAQQEAADRARLELMRRGVAPNMAESAAQLMVNRAIAELDKLIGSFGGAADALGQARRVLGEEGVAQRERLRSINPADALSAARATAAHGLLRAQEEMSRVGNQALDPLAAALRQQGQQLQGQAKQAEQFNATVEGNRRLGLNRAQAQAAAEAAQARRQIKSVAGVEPIDAATALARQQAEAAIHLNETYQKFFQATGNADLSALLALRELAKTQIQAAANARAMAAGFESLRAQQRAIQQQLQGVAKSFQMPNGRQ